MKNRPLVLAISFVLFIAVISAYTCGIILNSPVEITSATAGNFVCNIMNGGNVLEDEGYLFFANPTDRTLFRAESDHTEVAPVKIADNCDGYLQVVGNTYYYLSGKSFVSCDYNGKNQKTVLENVNQPQICGNTIFYINNEGSLCKYSSKYNKSTDLKVKPEGKYIIYYNKLYFPYKNGIYTVLTDGSEFTQFFDKPASMFTIDDKHLFYLSDKTVYSAKLTDSGMKSTSFTDNTEGYAVIIGSGTMITSSNGEIYFTDLNKSSESENYKPKQFGKCDYNGVFCDENYFYWFSDNKLIRIDSNGTNKIVFK